MKPSITLNRNVLKWLQIHSDLIPNENYKDLVSILKDETPELFKEDSLKAMEKDVKETISKNSKRGRKETSTMIYKDIFNEEIFGDFLEHDIIFALPFLPFIDLNSKGLAQTAYIMKVMKIIKDDVPIKGIYHLFSNILMCHNLPILTYQAFANEFKIILEEDEPKHKGDFISYPIKERIAHAFFIKNGINAMLEYLDKGEFT